MGLISQGARGLDYVAKTHNFNNTIKIGTKTVATTDLIPSLTNYVKNSSLTTTLASYATVAGDTFTGSYNHFCKYSGFRYGYNG